jgi:hypothetical protein
VFENRVLWRLFGPKRDGVTGGWRKLRNVELHNLYSSPNMIRMIKSRRMKWAGHVARMGETKNAYRILVGKPEGKRPLGRRRRRWVDNVKMDRMGWYGLDRTGSEEGPVECSCEHGDEPSGSIKCWEVHEWLQNLQLLKKGLAP